MNINNNVTDWGDFEQNETFYPKSGASCNDVFGYQFGNATSLNSPTTSPLTEHDLTNHLSANQPIQQIVSNKKKQTKNKNKNKEVPASPIQPIVPIGKKQKRKNKGEMPASRIQPNVPNGNNEVPVVPSSHAVGDAQLCIEKHEKKNTNLPQWSVIEMPLFLGIKNNNRPVMINVSPPANEKKVVPISLSVW